ncbi:MAG: hypothetical protein ACRDJN_29205, partial [Chloroflexota bacterium]
MIAKLLETLFRHKLLICLPPMLIPLIVGPIALYLAPVYYETWTGIWVDRPTYLDSKDVWNNYLTPAQNQQNRLTELLRTRAFLMSVASRTALAPLVGSTSGEERIHEVIGDGLVMFPNGSHLLVIRYRGPSPQLSFQVINALVETFKDKAVEDRTSQATLAISFYESRLQSAEQDLEKAQEAIRRYVAANPRLTTLDPERNAGSSAAARLGLPAIAVDPQLGELLRRLEVDERETQNARALLEQARLDASASLQGQELGFQVVDPPKMPERPLRQRRKALIYPAAGLVVGAGLGATVLVVLMAADRAVRSEADLPGL